MSRTSYQLKLPSQWKIHNVFHASLLTPYKETALNGNKYQEPAPDLIERQPEWEVERILQVRRYQKQLQYLVRWKGFSEAHDSWEPASNIHADELLQEFYKNHPAAIRNLTTPSSIIIRSMSTSTSLIDRLEDPPAPFPLVDPSPPRFSASTNPHPQAPDAATDADRLRNPDGRCLSPVTFHLADDTLPTFLPDWPPTAPHPPRWPTDVPYPLGPWPSPPESRSTTPDYHYDSCDDLCAASCNINTVLTLYGKPPPRSPQPVNSWPSLPDHDHWPDAPGTPFIPSNPHPTRAHCYAHCTRRPDLGSLVWLTATRDLTGT